MFLNFSSIRFFFSAPFIRIFSLNFSYEVSYLNKCSSLYFSFSIPKIRYTRFLSAYYSYFALSEGSILIFSISYFNSMLFPSHNLSARMRKVKKRNPIFYYFQYLISLFFSFIGNAHISFIFERKQDEENNFARKYFYS